MISVILYQPQIPPNTGNILRLCANSGADLHLVGPLGFSMDEKAYRRAGLDYHGLTKPNLHENWDACLAAIAGRRILAVTKFGKTRYSDVHYQSDDCLLFGSETDGLPDFIHQSLAETNKLQIPMIAGTRSLNLSNSTALVLYEAWRQLDFRGSTDYDPALG